MTTRCSTRLKSVFTIIIVLHTLALFADMEFSDDINPLMDDTDFQHMTEDMIPEFKRLFAVREPKRDSTIENLTDIKKAIEESYHKRTQAKVAGATAAAVGSTLSIVGFGLSFVTFGASVGLIIAGGALAGAGAVTMGGSDLLYFAVSKSKKSVATQAVNRDREVSEKVRKKAIEVLDCIETLSSRYPAIPKVAIFKAAVDYSKCK